MTTETKIKLLRLVSLVLLLTTLLGVMMLSRRERFRKIVTVNPRLEYIYSDDEMIIDDLPSDEGYDIYAMIRDADKKYEIDDDFLKFCAENENISPSNRLLSDCIARIESRGYDDEMWEELTGYTFSVLYDIYTGNAFEGGEVSVIGDVYTAKKTVISLFGSGYGGIIPNGIGAGTVSSSDLVLFTDDNINGNANVNGGGSEVTEYYISGGLKFAIVYTSGVNDAEAVAEAKKRSDFVIAMIQGEKSDADIADIEVKAAENGADLIVFTECASSKLSGILGYVSMDDSAVPVVYGIFGEGENAAYMTFSLTVGVSPILRCYPLSYDGEPLSEEKMLAEAAKRNGRYGSAVIADGYRVRKRS